MGCATDKSQSNKVNEAVKNEESKIIDEPFDIKLQIAKVDNEQYSLGVTIELAP